jgi:hypothetical protein
MDTLPIRLSVFVGVCVAALLVAFRTFGFLLYVAFYDEGKIGRDFIILFVGPPLVLGFLAFAVIELVLQLQRKRS